MFWLDYAIEEISLSSGSMAGADFNERLRLSSVQLNLLDKKKTPVGFASGCLIDYHGKRVLLTVAHATANQGNWAVQLRYRPGRGTENYQLGTMHFLAKASLKDPVLKDIDFSYVEVPSTIQPFRQDIVSKDVIRSETPITVHTPSLTDSPSPVTKYGFCGMVKPTHETHFGGLSVGGELQIHSGLTYSRTEGDYHVFSLPIAHPGHEHFEGCSGAPVLSESGGLVGLVCEGLKEKSEIWAISVSAYKLAIDILVGAL
jgi:hypothetical protein